jgi:hypothetical protein
VRREQRCERGCLTGDSLIETVDGPVAIGGLVGKSITVMTRLPNGLIGFRLFSKIAIAATAVPILRVTFDNGQWIGADHGHLFYGRDGGMRSAAELVPGELLDSSAHYPEGYVFRKKDGTTEVSAGAVAVASIEPAGVADVFGGIVNETGSYFVTAGVRCRA